METLLKIHTFLLGFLAFSLLAIVIIFKAPPIFKDDSMPNIYPAPHLDIFYQDDKLHRIFLVKSKPFSVATCNTIQKWIMAYLSNYTKRTVKMVQHLPLTVGANCNSPPQFVSNFAFGWYKIKQNFWIKFKIACYI